MNKETIRITELTSYKMELGDIPVFENQGSSKGDIVHSIFSRFWEFVKISKENLKLEEHYEKFWLSIEFEELVTEEFEVFKNIFNQLLKVKDIYFKDYQKIELILNEEEFEKETKEFIIHGHPDLISKIDGKYYLFDYKTGYPKSFDFSKQLGGYLWLTDLNCKAFILKEDEYLVYQGEECLKSFKFAYNTYFKKKALEVFELDPKIEKELEKFYFKKVELESKKQEIIKEIKECEQEIEKIKNNLEFKKYEGRTFKITLSFNKEKESLNLKKGVDTERLKNNFVDNKSLEEFFVIEKKEAKTSLVLKLK